MHSPDTNFEPFATHNLDCALILTPIKYASSHVHATLHLSRLYKETKPILFSRVSFIYFATRMSDLHVYNGIIKISFSSESVKLELLEIPSLPTYLIQEYIECLSVHTCRSQCWLILKILYQSLGLKGCMRYTFVSSTTSNIRVL